MKPVVLSPAAEEEMLISARDYENTQSGLGDQFLDELIRAGARIAEHPEAWPTISGKIRRCLFNRFPFGLIFRIEAERIYVLAVMHMKRKPNYWNHR
jgi:plasmid stabilization system protein ParE